MSVRTIDTRFNLRTVVEAETASIPLVLTQAPASGLFSNTSTPPKPKGPGIKFDFGQLKSTPYAATPAPVPTRGCQVKPAAVKSGPDQLRTSPHGPLGAPGGTWGPKWSELLLWEGGEP